MDTDSEHRIDALLIVDDCPEDVEIAKRILAKSGRINTVLSASDGAEALDLLEQGLPQVILIDINMPVMDGFEFLEHYAKRYGDQDDVAILMLTSSEYGPDQEKATANSLVQGYIAKPITKAQAVELVDRYGRVLVDLY